MDSMIPAYEAERGRLYRLFPSGKRSRHIVAQFLGISPKGHPLFVFTDPETQITVLITDVDIHENVQAVGVKVIDNHLLN